jgi:hypothetical protein
MISSRSMGRHLLRLAPALLIAAVATCGPFRRGAGPEPALLVFSNESLAQADVYLVPQGLNARRIGTVMSGRTDTLVVPADLAARGGTMNVVARLLAHSEVPQTGPVTILPGDRYEVRLPSDARLLSIVPARS